MTTEKAIDLLTTMPGNEKWTKEQIDIVVRSRGCCEYCGDNLMVNPASFWASQWEHIIPQASGGGHAPENLALACAKCNSIKSDSPPENTSLEKLRALGREEKISKIAEWVMKEREKRRVTEVWQAFKVLIDPAGS